MTLQNSLSDSVFILISHILRIDTYCQTFSYRFVNVSMNKRFEINIIAVHLSFGLNPNYFGVMIDFL